MSIYKCIYICIYIYTCICIYNYINKYMCMHMYIYIYIYTHVYYIYVYIYIHTYTHVYIYVYISSVSVCRLVGFFPEGSKHFLRACKRSANSKSFGRLNQLGYLKRVFALSGGTTVRPRETRSFKCGFGCLGWSAAPKHPAGSECLGCGILGIEP